jgi:hypothetical protein
MAEGNYDVIPRGIIVMQSPQIDIQGLSNKYTRMTYTNEDKKGEMRAYSSYTNSIPLIIPFEITIKLDTLLDSFKLYQTILTTFYKTYKFNFRYEGFPISAQVGFPEMYETNKQIEFSYNNNPQFIELKFLVNVETYFPEKDLTTERFRGNLMQGGITMNQIIKENITPGNNLELL